MGIKEKLNEEITGEKIKAELNGKTPLAVVGDWLKKALEEHGIGAKTAVGYGLMKYEEDENSV